MGVSTNGQICFGVLCEEGQEFPWDEYDGEEEWWLKICAFKPSLQVYDLHGNRLPGITEAQCDKYWEEKRAFAEAHPLPVELVNYCSGDYPMYILAAKDTCQSASRGNAEEFAPAKLTVTPEQTEQLLDFCRKHIEWEGGNPPEPKWYLSSYWG